MSLSATLRGHSHGVGILKFVDQFLYSGGSDGMLIEWDLNTRRVRRSWQGHTSMVVLLDYFKFDGVPVLLSHSRDATVKFWDVSSTLEQPEHTEMPVNALNFCNVSLLANGSLLLTPATVDLDHFDIYRLLSIFPLQFDRVVQNVDPLELHKRLAVVDESNGQRGGLGIMMRSVWTQVGSFETEGMNDSSVHDSGHVDNNCDQTWRSQNTNSTERLINTSNEGKTDSKSNNATKIYRFSIGYESGAVLAFSLRIPHASIVKSNTKSGSSVSIINRPAQIAVDYFYNVLSPSPVVSLQYSVSKSTIVAGSSSKKLAYLTYTNECDAPDTFRQDGGSKSKVTSDDIIRDSGVVSLKYGGIGALAVLNSTMAVAFWNGIVRGFDIGALVTENVPLWHVERALPMVESLNDTVWKPTALDQRKRDVVDCHDNGDITDGYINMEGTMSLSREGKGSRKMIRSKRGLLYKDILAVGYENGIIALYEV